MTFHQISSQYDKACKELSLFVRGGQTEDGVVVKGAPLEPGSTADHYSIYSLALSKANRWNDAVQVAQLILQNIAEDQDAYYNAQEAIRICQKSEFQP